MRLHWSDQIGRSSVPRMEFGILGPLEVRTDSGAVAIGGAKPRALLALLLLHANEAVHPERLALALWDEDAPPSAAKTVQVYVSRLRKALADPEILVNTPAGYRLRVRAGELDADRFAAALEAGRQALAAGRAEHAAVVLREGAGAVARPAAERFDVRTVCRGRDCAPAGAAPGGDRGAHRG